MGPLCYCVPYVNIYDINLKIQDIFYNNRWKFDSLYTNLSEEIRLQIIATSIVKQVDVNDVLVWASESNGTYSASAGCKWIQQNRHAWRFSSHQTWAWIWKLHVPEKNQAFSVVDSSMCTSN